MGKKKINIVATVINDLNSDQRMIRIGSSLQNAGYNFLLIGRNTPQSEGLKQKPYRQKRLKLLATKGPIFYLFYNFRLFLYLLFVKTDVFYAVDVDTILPNLCAAKLRRKKLVFDAHEYFSQVPEVLHRPKVQKIWEWIENFAIPKVDMAFTVGPALAEIFSQKWGVQFKAIRNVPFKQPPLKFNPSERKDIVLYQGALNKGRGLEPLVNAMENVKGELWLIGEGDLSESLRNQVENLPWKDKIKFVGWVAPDKLWSYTLQAKVGINVSENLGLSYYYSLNNKCFDYFGAGLPAVTNKFPEYIQLNKEYNTMVFADCTSNDIAKAINLLLIDRQFYHKLYENCLIASQHYCWENEEIRLIRSFNEQLQSH